MDLTKQQETSLKGTYTRMLRAVLNISWKEHPTNKVLYGHFIPIADTIRESRLRFAGHSWRSKEEIVSDVMLWRPTQGTTSVGRPSRTYINQLADDAGCLPEDLPGVMEDRTEWKERVKWVRDNLSTG